MPETNARIKVCHDTAANFKTNNPTLLVGEWALETDTKKMKIGDGVTAYNALQYSTAEESEEWQKPADWVDIRSGARPNSVYFLVAHGVPTENEGTYSIATYPKFSVRLSVSNSGTYDVFVDGIKIVTTAHNTATLIDWATLYNNATLAGGYEVAYPSTMVTHVVRVTPSVSTNTISSINLAAITGQTEQGVLWTHFTTKNKVGIRTLFCNNASFSQATVKSLLLEAVTCDSQKLLCDDLYLNFAFCSHLKTVCPLDVNNSATNFYGTFRDCALLKTISLSNYQQNAFGHPDVFRGCSSLKTIQTENFEYCIGDHLFGGCAALQSVPQGITTTTNDTSSVSAFEGCTSLKNTFLDYTASVSMRRLTLGGSASKRLDGIKGLAVSNSAPFSNATSPQLDVSYTGMNRGALVNLFNSMPTVTDSQVCNVTGATGAAALDATDLAIATSKGWTVTR